MSGFEWKKEVGAFTAMAATELTTVGINTLYKAASLKGLSYFVFIAYTYIIGTLVIVPVPFIFPRRELPPFRLSVFFKIVLSSLIGMSINVCMFKGIEYSSPVLCSTISNLVPALTFILAVAFRMENPDLRRKTTQFKIIGTILSVLGAFIAVVYKGPTVISSASSASTSPSSSHALEISLQANWILGGLLLVLSTLLASFWFIVQAQVMKVYPDERTVAALYFLGKTVFAVPICILADSKLSHWTLKTNIALYTVVLSGLFGSSFFAFLTTWVLRLKGPLYASIFRPFSIAIAAAFGVIFLGNPLFLGSVIGAAIMLVGFYAVLLVKAREEDYGHDSPHEQTPLLQS